MIDPTSIELTAEILNELIVEKIIFAEFALPGAMGRKGQAKIYYISDGNYYRYEADCFKMNPDLYFRTIDFLVKNIRNNKNIYLKMLDFLGKDKNKISTCFKDETQENGIFEFYYGGMGNYFFINKNITLKQADEYCIYTEDKKEYNVYISCYGVFFHVGNAINIKNKNTRDVPGVSTEFKGR